MPDHRVTHAPSRRTGSTVIASAIAGIALLVAAPAQAAPTSVTASNLAPDGFPDARSTGVRAGVTLQPSGSVTVTNDGTVLTGLDISGTVTIEADDVVIRDSRIRSTGTIPIRNRGQNLIIEDTEIDGQGQLGPAVAFNKYTLRRVNIHNIGEGPRIAGGNVVIEDSYIHHLVQVGDNHTDALQVVSGKNNIVIRGNSIHIWNPDSGMYGNAAFQFGEEDGPVRNCLVEGNYMNGGNYTVNGGGGGTRGAACTFRDNVFGSDHRYGIRANLGPNVVWEASNSYYQGSPTAPDPGTSTDHSKPAAPTTPPAAPAEEPPHTQPGAGPSTPRAATAPPAPATQAQLSPTQATEKYVDRVYRDLFGRAPDPVGMRTWTTRLHNGSARNAVANSITASTEYRRALISASYRAYLNRLPDSVGLRNWLVEMSRGLTIQEMEAGFLASAEYFARAGNSNGRWVSALYKDVLGRSASATEVDSWTRALSRGASRKSVAVGFLLSTEHLTTVIDGYYRDLLGRSIDPSGRITWVRAVQNGTRIENIIGAIVSSDEYVAGAR